MGFNYSRTAKESTRFSKSSSFTFGAGVRYYPVGDLFARIGYSGIVRKEADFSSALGVSVGYDLFLSDKVFFEPALSYSKNLSKLGNHNLGLSLGIGVKF